jgi:hypothetical protein
MPYECKICQNDPSSHSLKKIGTTDNVTYYYTCPAKATKYHDADGIAEHYDGVLSENENRWIWVFDCKKFATKHLLEVDVAIKLAKLISTKFSSTLDGIVIINPTWHIFVIMRLVNPFLNSHVKSIIKIVHDQSFNLTLLQMQTHAL